MRKILVTESQFKKTLTPQYKKNVKIFKENWSELSDSEKILVVELYKIFYPKKVKNLKEGVMDWVQTGLDVAGIFDPTGIADLTNAVLYFGRGEALFGMLSLVSIIPYAGDAIAKPIILGGKALGVPFKMFKAAVATGDASKIAKSAKAMEKLGPVGKKIVEFIESFGKGLGDKILQLISKGKKIPVVGRFASVIEDWVKIFKKAAQEIKLPTKGGFNIVGKGISGPEKVDFAQTIKQMFKPLDKNYGTTAFRDFSKRGTFKLAGKEFTKIWQVPKTRKLLGKTKLFARFLDSLGIANFVGPDELTQQIPNAQQKFEEFMNKPENQSSFNDEIFNSDSSTQSSPSSSEDGNIDFGSIIKNLGITSITPEMKTILSQFLKTAV